MGHPIRIQFMIATLDRAGAEGQLTALLTGLDRAKFEPHLICLTRGGPHEDALKAANVPYTILGKSGKLDLFSLFRIRTSIRAFRPDILHTWMFTSNAYGRVAGLMAGVPILIASERAVDSWKTWPYRTTDRILARWTNHIVGNCGAVADFAIAESGIASDQVSVIPNGVDVTLFEQKEHSDHGETVFSTVGRLAPQKRIDLFINAIALLRKRGVAARAVIAGDGELRAELQESAKNLGVDEFVTFKGAITDIPEFLGATDVFVLSSDWEGMPNVVLEAMSAGLPVVATAVDGTRELVISEQTGQLVHPGDAESLATAMEAFTNVEQRVKSGRLGRQRAESEYSMVKMVERYQELYQKLLRRRG